MAGASPPILGSDHIEPSQPIIGPDPEPTSSYRLITVFSRHCTVNSRRFPRNLRFALVLHRPIIVLLAQEIVSHEAVMSLH